MTESHTIDAGIGITNNKTELFNMFGGRFMYDKILEDGNPKPSIASLGAGAAHFEYQLAERLSKRKIEPQMTLVDSSEKMCDLMRKMSQNYALTKNCPIEIVQKNLVQWIKTNRNVDYLILRNVTHFLDIAQFKDVLQRIGHVTTTLAYVLTASSFNKLSLNGQELKRDSCLISKRVDGVNIPNNTVMTFLDDSDAISYSERQTGMRVVKFERNKYPTDSDISNGLGPEYPDSLGVYLKRVE